MQYNPHENLSEQDPLKIPTPSDDIAESKKQSGAMFSAVVKAKESQADVWTETVEVISVSQGGAGFYLQRECRAGQLISLLMPMPGNLRRFDFDKKLYKVWGLVQHCSKMTDDIGFHVGVAFVGSNAPQSYYDKPSTSYRVCGVGKDGFWKIDETETPFKTRKNTRFFRIFDVSLFVLNSDNVPVSDEKTVTENISESGASVVSYLNINTGDRVKFYSREYKFTAIALVRNRKIGDDDRPRLHLEFVEDTFPVSDLGGAVQK